MSMKLAMVACLGPHEGPWARTRGSERELRISGDGHVQLQCEDSTGLQRLIDFDSPGVFVFPEGVVRYRLCKPSKGTPTTVEVVQ
jgi:hypothetical protein